MTAERYEKFAFTYTIFAETNMLIVPKPGEESRLFAFIRPFQPMVYCVIFTIYNENVLNM